jgi:hypothetical protein
MIFLQIYVNFGSSNGFHENLIQKRKENKGTMLGLIRPKALAQRPCAWLRMEAEKSNRALVGQPSSWPQSARVAHARLAGGACPDVVSVCSPERQRGCRHLTGVLGASGSAVKA